jgi:hypothetical protein
VTVEWRDVPLTRPEERLIGVMYAADPVDGDIVVDDASHWVFEGTGVKRGDRLHGLLGYEVDAIYGSGPRTLERLAHSPYVDHGRTRYADMTIYTADSGALVFATGSMQWNWGLDDYNAPQWHERRVNVTAQRVTRNMLARMLRGRGEHPAVRTGVAWLPSPLVLIASAIAALFVLRAWLTRPSRGTKREPAVGSRRDRQS